MSQTTTDSLPVAPVPAGPVEPAPGAEPRPEADASVGDRRADDSGADDFRTDDRPVASSEPLDSRSTLRRSGSVGIASVASMAGGLATNKVTAVLVGAGGVGYHSVLLGHAANVALIADLNVTHGMVRRVAGAPDGSGAVDPELAVDGAVAVEGTRALTSHPRDASVIIAAAVSVTLCTSAVLVACAAVAARPLAARLLPAPGGAGALLACVVAGCLLMLTAQMQAATSALGALRAYRRGLVLQACTAPVVVWAVLHRSGVRGLPAAQVAVTTVGLVISAALLLHAARAAGLRRPALGSLRPEIGSLLRQGVFFTVAALVGSGATNVLPLLVLNRLGSSAAGQFRAAAVLSAGYVTVLTTTLGREFLPRASALAARRDAFNATVNRQVRIICALGTPVVLAGIVLSPIAVRLLFTGEFGEAVRIMSFQFPGDLLRLVSQTFVYSLIAARGGRLLVVAELAGGVLVLGCSLGGMALLGLPGLGLASTVAYGAYALVAACLLRSSTGFRLGRRTARLLTASMLAVCASTLGLMVFGRGAGSVLAGITLAACLALLVGRLVPRAPAFLARFGGWFDHRVLGPSLSSSLASSLPSSLQENLS